MGRILLVALVLTMVAALVAGCAKGSSTSSTTTTSATSTATTTTASPSPSATIQKEPYKIGAVFAVTGNNAPLGTPEKQTVEMMVDQINAKGGINGHKLEVVIYDTKSDTTECVNLVKKLIEQDKVLAIIGPSSSGESMALIDVVTKAEIPLVSAAASAAIVEPAAERKWVFKTPQSDVLAINEITEYLTKKLSAKNVAILSDSAGYGQAGQKVLQTALPAAGLTIVADEKFGVADTDMSPQLTKIKGTGAEAIIVWGTNPGPALVSKNAKELNITLPIINSHGIANKAFLDLGGDAVNGVVFPAGKLLVADQLADSDPQKTLLVNYKKDFEAKYGAGTANTFGGHAYDALNMVVEALKAVGPDKAKIRDYIENNIKNFPGTGGIFTMSPQDHNGLSKGAFVLIKVVDGKWTWLK